MESVWQRNLTRGAFDRLNGSKSTDVLIIGGGIAGILCAYRLYEAGISCTLLEAEEICSGITKNTTAKITLQHGLIYDKLIGRFGYERAKAYLEAQSFAVEEYARLSRSVQCDYEKKDSYVYSLTDTKRIEREIKALALLGLKAEYSQAEELPFQVAAAVKVKDQAQFDPLKFIYSIAEGLPIYERTKVREFIPGAVKTENGEVRYKKAIVATHFPILNKHGVYPLKLYQHRSYVLALKNADMIDGMYVDESEKGMSFRTYRDLLLVGGGSHRTGKSGGGFSELEAFKKDYYPDAQTVYRWATQDCMTLDGVPYVGRYSKATKNLFVVTGFNKWGMTSSMVAATVLLDLVRERKNEYASLFSPSRSILRPQLAVNAFESLIGLLTPTAPRCPHLGCALKYNRQEHSWDCPCHGSRFSESGELIDNPATDGKRIN